MIALAALLAVALGPPGAVAAPLPTRVTSVKDGAPMVLVKAGRYFSGIAPARRVRLVTRLGEPAVSFYKTELPEVVRELPDFYIDVHEVTNEQYRIFLEATQRAAPAYWGTRHFGRPRQPIVGVGWPDAEAYCAWAGKRLPTEFEWEKAARGVDRRTWPWGDGEKARNFNGRYAGQRAPVEVGSHRGGASPYGLLDMAGNVWEMTTSHWPDAESHAHTMKGGSFLNTHADVRVTVRWAADDELHGASWLGFRCVMDRSALGSAAR